jgi:aspartate-semialdehyde dehydrogenase
MRQCRHQFVFHLIRQYQMHRVKLDVGPVMLSEETFCRKRISCSVVPHISGCGEVGKKTEERKVEKEEGKTKTS